MPHVAPRLLLLGLVALAVGGCGREQARDDVRTTTARFYDAIRAGDGAVACAQLGDDTRKALEDQSGAPCAEAVTELDYEGGPIARLEVYAANAKVDVGARESAFLSLGPDGWKLSAVGCRPEAGKPHDRPYECEVEA